MSTLPGGQKSWSVSKAVLQWWRGWTRRASARPNFAGSRILVLTQPIFCCVGWQRLTSTETRCPGPNLERSKIFSEFAQCVTIIAAAGGILRAIPLIRRGRIIAQTPRRSWRSTRCLGVRGVSGN
jgi:hypothetical protein